MTWLVWRQHRIEIVLLLIGAGLIAAALVYGADLATRLRLELGVDTCRPLPDTNMTCVTLGMEAGARLQPFRMIVFALLFVPALVGSYVGGPLFARDLERGTNRLLWTQGITRLRWAGAKLAAVLGSGAVAAAIVASVGGLAITINGPSAAGQDAAANRYPAFDLEGPAFVSHVVFAIALGAFAGTFSRRILTGMLGGLLLSVIVWAGVTFELRRSYEPPIASLYSIDNPFPQARVPQGAWVVGTDYLDREGRVVPQARIGSLMQTYRPAPGRAAEPVLSYLAENDALQRVSFHPADRYWRFQWIEGALFLALSAALSAATLLLLKRRDA